MLFKNITLTETRWNSICASLESTGSDVDKTNAAMLREQLNGDVKVTATRKTVSFKAPKGADLRSSLVSQDVRR